VNIVAVAYVMKHWGPVPPDSDGCCTYVFTCGVVQCQRRGVVQTATS